METEKHWSPVLMHLNSHPATAGGERNAVTKEFGLWWGKEMVHTFMGKDQQSDHNQGEFR